MNTVDALAEMFIAAGNQYGLDGRDFTILRGKEMTLQPALFGPMPTQPPQADPMVRRRKAMEESLKLAGEKFRDAFESFVIGYLERHGKGDGESIREAYEKTSNPRPHRWQAAGGVYARLRRDGKIVEVAKVRSRYHGNDIAVIKLRETNA
jgi:hypothetical protein